MSDSLSQVRKVLRRIKSAQRKELRQKMNKYNGLTKKAKTPDDLYDLDKAKTTQDVIAETLAIRNGETVKGGRRFSVSHTRQDKLFQDASIVQPEVRSAWQQKIGMVSLLSDDARAKLLRTTNGLDPVKVRDTQLDTLAHWMVYMWCEGEGYDPNKHPKQHV